AFALDIGIESLRADVTVLPLVQASAEVPGNRAWIRYAVLVDTSAAAEELRQLHWKVQRSCVCRLEREYGTQISGSLLRAGPPIRTIIGPAPGGPFLPAPVRFRSARERSALPGSASSDSRSRKTPRN